MRDPKNNNELNNLTDSLIRYLDCPCRYFPPSDNDSELMRAYDNAIERGKKEGFVPMIVAVDSTLWECLEMNTEQNADENFEFNAEKVFRSLFLRQKRFLLPMMNMRMKKTKTITSVMIRANIRILKRRSVLPDIGISYQMILCL